MPRSGDYRFGPFAFDSRTGELSKSGRKLKLGQQPARVLSLLLNAGGELVTREQLQKEIWGDGTFVDFEHGINFCIRKIRAALGDVAREPQFIETLPKLGYRFVGEMQTPAMTPAAGATENGGASDARLIQAYEHYSKARQSFVRFGKAAMEEARREFELAVDLNPNYAMAQSGLGAAYALRTINRRDPADLDKARTHLEKAVALDPEISEPYPWLCYVHLRRGDMTASEAAGRRAIALQPDSAVAHYFFGGHYWVRSEQDPRHWPAAGKHLTMDTRLDPSWQPGWFVAGHMALLNGDYPRARLFAGRILDAASGMQFVGAKLVLGSVELRTGNHGRARETLQEFLRDMEASDHMYGEIMFAAGACLLGDTEIRDGRSEEALAAYRRAWQHVQAHPRMMSHQRVSARVQAGMAAGYATTGNAERAGDLFSKALELLPGCELPSCASAGAALPELYWSVACAAARLGRNQTALEMLRKAVEAGSVDVAWLHADPELAPVRDSHEFAEILDLVAGFPKAEFQCRDANSR